MIILREVSKSYDGRTVLDGVSESIAGGEICALMGPSGAGKTTLLRLIAGLELPDAGEILLREEENAPPAAPGTPGRGGRRKVQARIGFMFQEDRLLEYMDAGANIRFVNPACSEDTINRILGELGLGGQDRRRPVREFSGGMKRRAALARTLLSETDILLLDEPFKGLDEDTAELAIRCLLRARRGRTVIFSTHSLQEAELCGARIIHVPGMPDDGAFL